MDVMHMKPLREDDLRIAEEAAEWLHRLHEQGEDAACLSALSAWLRQSPRHLEEFLMITAISKELDAVDPERHIDVRSLLAEAPDNLVPLRAVAAKNRAGTERSATTGRSR